MDMIFKYWLEFSFTLIITVVTFLIKKLNEYKNILKSTTKGVEVLLKTKIIQNYNMHKTKGSITIYEKEIINELYREYKNLGGKGVIDSIKKDIDKLPLISEEEN